MSRSAPPGPTADGPGFPAEVDPEGWRTGTAIDEFTPLYLALGRQTKRHGPIGPAEVDALDLSVVAALLGVGGDEDGFDFEAAAADMVRARAQAEAEGRPFTW